jgi:YesN/AraC family two-component response regulator
LPSITEIEELIVQLHNEGKTMREIAKVVHKNFTYIGAILRRRFPEEFIDNSKSNKETKALKLFYEKSLLRR